MRRPFDSSRTRVGPILGGLSEASAKDPQWLRRLLDLAAGPGEHPWQAQDLRVLERYHHPAPGATQPGERGLHPPVALLSWLIRTGRFEVYVRPYPDVNSGRWQVSQAGGLQPLWSRNGRELFYTDGAKMLIGAAVLPGATFTLGAQVPLFNTRGFASNVISLFYDVSPDGQRFLFLREPTMPTTERSTELVQITNWGAEVQAKLAGETP